MKEGKQRLWPWKLAILLLIAFDFLTPQSGLLRGLEVAAAQTVYPLIASMTGNELVELYTATGLHVFASASQLANTATAPANLTSLKFSSLPSGTAVTYACFTSSGQLISSAAAC